jgi:2-dehydro-3-deoxygluconokinase
VAPFVDWLLPSHPADSVLLGDEAMTLPADDFAGAAQSLDGFAALGPRVALKLGPRGCLMRAAGASLHVEGVGANKVLDTTGAGDLWNGSFLMALRQGQAPGDAAIAAHTLASRKLAYRGAIPPASLYDSAAVSRRTTA